MVKVPFWLNEGFVYRQHAKYLSVQCVYETSLPTLRRKVEMSNFLAHIKEFIARINKHVLA